METQHEDGPVMKDSDHTNIKKCLACIFVASSQEELEMHIVSSHSFPCDICGLVCMSIENLSQHGRSHSNKDSINCQAKPRTTKCEQCDFEKTEPRNL